MRRICELCGNEEIETGEDEAVKTRILYLCDDCQNDRAYNHFDN
jgi:ribosome-binding protein aMBF1 (putative translation factor)